MHIHVPDGVFPVWLWMGSIIILIPLLAFALFMVRKNQKKLVMTSAITALMLIVFSIEVFGFHLNFTSLSGILLGPWWSLISITVTNIFLALFGHGGVTVSPINILLNWAEALVGYLLYKMIISRFSNNSLKSILSGTVVLASLAVSFALFVGIVSLTGINAGSQLEEASGYVPLKEFVAISILPTIIGGIIEAALTMLMIRFILRTKPGLLK
jgi:ABC-type Co2+ transport system permease subunit